MLGVHFDDVYDPGAHHILLDGQHKDLRRAQTAASTWSHFDRRAKALGFVITALESRLYGLAVRVPMTTGSLRDLAVETKQATSMEVGASTIISPG